MLSLTNNTGGLRALCWAPGQADSEKSDLIAAVMKDVPEAPPNHPAGETPGTASWRRGFCFPQH